ncbi:MAG: nicotinate-nucleotide--dimethylbenzimidazole phosphoribosyltransferase [Chloroflexota bacterium]
MTYGDDRSLLNATIEAIRPPDDNAIAASRERQGQLTKPPGSLGRLEALAERIAGITGQSRPHLDKRLVVVAAGDHGVTAQGVSAYPAEVTAQMVANFLHGGAAINVLAAHAGARVRVVDAGVAAETPLDPRLVRLRLAPGTEDFTQTRAMTLELATTALAAGIRLFESERAADGVDIVACGEMGIGNTTSAAAIIATVTGRPVRTVTGRGTGIDDEHFEAKVGVIERALALHRPDRTDGLELLSCIGGLEIGVLAGVYLAGAAAGVPVVIDGVISSAAALIAAATAPASTAAMLASHLSVEPGHIAALQHLHLEPLLDLGLRLGEGTGAALGITLCVAACRLLDEMATFGEAGVTESDEVVPPES